MVIGQATILAAKICFIILYNAAANKEIVRGIAYFPIRTPSPSRLFESLGILEFLSSSKLFQIKHFMASGQKRARDCHQQFRASHICYKEFLCMSGYTDCFIFFHFLMLIKIRRSAIARPIRSVTVPGMNINRPPTIKAVRFRYSVSTATSLGRPRKSQPYQQWLKPPPK